jgi:acyl phosphate:glycerol-3-phosphate acyltransferase
MGSALDLLAAAGEWRGDHPAVLASLVVVGYLIGSIPFGVLIAAAHHVDLRKVGSGNVGATNVGRVLGRQWGFLCFFLDVGKGLSAVMMARWAMESVGGDPTHLLHQAMQVGVGCAAIAGHVFNIWLHFAGGKGVATSLGVVLGIYPYFTYAGLCALGIWIVVTMVSRYVSLGSVVAAIAFLPLFVVFNWAFKWATLADVWPTGLFAVTMTAIILVRHRSNIRRLLAGTENKIGRKKVG